MLKHGTAFSIAMEVAYSSVNIDSHVRPVVVSSHCVIHTTLSRVTEKRRMMRQVEEALSL